MPEICRGFHGRFSNPSDLCHLKLSEVSVTALQDACLTMFAMVMMYDSLDQPPCKKKQKFYTVFDNHFFGEGSKKFDFGQVFIAQINKQMFFPVFWETIASTFNADVFYSVSRF